MSGPCLILEISNAKDWEPFRGCRRIPPIRQPSVLHPSREVAEAEALKLSAEHPGRMFAVFELALAATTTKVPTHITLGGKVVAERYVPSLVEIGEPDIPF